MFLAGVLATSAGFAQSPLTISETVEVRLVDLDVLATGGDGKPLGDLTLEELRLFVDGKPVAIRSFTGGAAAAQDVAPRELGRGPAVSSNRLTLYLDDFFLSPVSRKQAVATLREFLKTSVPDGTEVSLVTFDRKGLTVRVPFTGNKSRISSALGELPIESTEGFRRSSDRESTLGSIREMQRSRTESQAQVEADGTSAGRVASASDQPPCGQDLLEWARGYGASEAKDAERSLHSLRLFVDSLATTPGRKVLLHVSDGIPLRGGIEAFSLLRALCDGSGVRQGLQGAIDASMIENRGIASTRGAISSGSLINPAMLASTEQEYDLSALLRELVARANTLGVTLYTLQATGLVSATGESATRSSRSSTPEIERSARANLQDTLSSLAIDTGGSAILNRNDFGVALEAIERDRQHSYSLAFEPPVPGGASGAASKRPHAIRLETTRAGVELRYRKSYLDEPPTGDVNGRLMAALFHGAAENPLGLELDLKPAPRGGDSGGGSLEPENRWLARLTVPVESLAILPDASGVLRSGLLAVHMVMQDDFGISPLRRKEVPVRLPLAPAGAAEPPYVYEVRFTKPAGRVTVAIALEDILGRKVAVVRREIG